MTRKRKLLALVVMATITIITGVTLLHNRHTDACSSTDRQQNNCVPAGRCTPPGDSREAVVDCALKNYDHKFNSSK